MMQANKSTLCYEKHSLPQIQAFCHLSTSEIKLHTLAHKLCLTSKKKKERKQLSDKALYIFTKLLKLF